MSGDQRGKIERRLGDLMEEPTPDGDDEDDAVRPEGRPGPRRDRAHAAHGRHHRSPRRPRRAPDPHRGRARAGRPAAAPAGSAVLLLRRPVRGRACSACSCCRSRWRSGLALLAGVGPGRSCCTVGAEAPARVPGAAPGHAEPALGLDAGRVLVRPGPRVGGQRGDRADPARAAAGVHRVAPRPSDRGRARGLGAAA